MNKKNRMKKGLWILLSIVVIVNLAVVGLGLLKQGPEGGEYEQGVLRVWVTWGDDRDQLQPIFARYTQETGQQVKVATGVELDQLEKALSASAPPDVVILSNNALVNLYYEQGLIDSLDSWVETTGIDLVDIYPASLAQCEMVDGALPCLPWGGDVFALFWNKDLFSAAGLDPERPPQTMEEMLVYAELLTIRDEQGELSQVGFIPDFPRSHTDLYAHMFGGFWYTDNGGELTVNSQPVIEALSWQQQFYTMLGIQEADQFVKSINHYMNSSHPVFGGTQLSCQQCHRYALSNPEKNPDHGFYDGKVAMMVDGEWQLGTNYIPHLYPDLNYSVAPFPPSANHPERTNSSIVQGPVAILPSGGLEKKAAANLLAWIMSPETVAEAALATTSLPTSRTASQDGRFQEIPYFQVFLNLMADPKTSAIVSTPISLEVNTALKKAEKDILHQEVGEPISMLEEVLSELAPNLYETPRDLAKP